MSVPEHPAVLSLVQVVISGSWRKDNFSMTGDRENVTEEIMFKLGFEGKREISQVVKEGTCMMGKREHICKGTGA